VGLIVERTKAAATINHVQISGLRGSDAIQKDFLSVDAQIPYSRGRVQNPSKHIT
jgi:hypothetical protein